MSNDVPLIGIERIVGRASSKDGKFGLFDLIAPTGEKFKLAMSDSIAGALSHEIPHLRDEMAEMRSKKGGSRATPFVVAKKVSMSEGAVDAKSGWPMLHLTYDDGTKTSLLVEGVALDELIVLLSHLKASSRNA